MADTVVNFDVARRSHTDPGSLRIQHFQQSIVVLVEQDGSPGNRTQLHCAAYVIDVSVCDDDLLDL